MAAYSLYLYNKFIKRCHAAARYGHNSSRGQILRKYAAYMSTEHCVHIIHAAVIDHAFCSPASLLICLKEKLYAAAELILMLIKHLCSAKEHGHMGIMPAGMHGTLVPGFIIHFIFLSDGQSIHISPESQRLSGLSSFYHGYKPAVMAVLRKGDTILLKLPFHIRSGLGKHISHLRYLMQLPSHPYKLFLKFFALLPHIYRLLMADSLPFLSE